jgi:ribosomal protein S18 acetylase RimI-like enzyme
LKEGDKDEIRELHQKWFPVQYKSIFYDSIVINQMISSDKSAPPIPLFTCAALIQNYQSMDERSMSGDSLIVKTLSPPPPSSSSVTMCREEDEGSPSSLDYYHHQQQHQQKHQIWQLEEQKISRKNPIYRKNNYNDKIVKNPEDTCSSREPVKVTSTDETCEALKLQQKIPSRTEKIIGCIVGSFNSLDNIESSLSTFLIEDPHTHSRVFYIMTLGTATEYRKLGIGSNLVERAISYAKQDERCGAVYLHVITYNQTAISFYEKLGFVFGRYRCFVRLFFSFKLDINEVVLLNCLLLFPLKKNMHSN